ncbi:chondroitinase family polysaccharide lyase, partial [Prolixibacteraceae bacterium]|nr:chondroitinase family polysaccharide lyase [Prolixibacteraceae bacterium]
RNLLEMKRWMDESLKYSNGTIGGIKVDGSSYHHGALYPAYAVGGFSGLGKYVNLTRNTPFGLSNDSRIHMWEGMRAMIRYSQKRSWGLGVSGRHPLETNGQISNGTIYAMGYLAEAGNPYTDAQIWDEVGAQYLRFEPRNTSSRKAIVAAGVTTGKPYQGAFTYNYSAFGVYRRDNWLVSIKGYNKYTFGSEIYETDNRYGRYQSYGTVQVLNGSSATNANNGYNENGWDWNRAPGATFVHLPFDQLESYKGGDHMATGSHSQRGTMAFTGYANLDNQYGLFGMLLREENTPKFVPSHQADKSVFAFDRYVVCKGTNISNDNATYRTETAIFQNQLSSKAQRIVVDGNEITSFPYTQDLTGDNPHWIIDTNNNGYWIKSGQSIEIRKQTQNSKSNNLRLDTTGDFAVAVINHGKAPKTQTYEYVILPNTTIEEMQKFAIKMASEDKTYIVEQATTNYHVYNAPAENVKGYCFFNAASLNNELVTNASRACLILTKKINVGRYKISYTDPDIRLKVDKVLTTSPSQYGDGIITLNGSLHFVGDHKNCELVSRDSKKTVIKFSTAHGMKNEVTMEEANSPILINESFENAPSLETYQLSYTHDLSNKDYFNRYQLSSMNKYYAKEGRIFGTHEAYLLAGANLHNASGEPIEVTFAPVTRTDKIKSIHCSFLLGTLFSPANKFEELDFVKLEYKDKDGNYQPIGQLIGTKWSSEAAATDPNFGKIGTDLDMNGIIDADVNTQYSDNTTAKKFNFEIHNIDINTLELRIQLFSDHTYEAVHIDQVIAYEMQNKIDITNITRTDVILSADATPQKSGKLYYIYTNAPVENITTQYIEKATDPVAKDVVNVNQGQNQLISHAKTSDQDLYLYMFLEDTDGIRSEIKSVTSTNTSSNNLLERSSIRTYKSMGQLHVDGLEFAKKYTISIFNLQGAQIHTENIKNSEQTFIDKLDELPNFFIVRIMEGNSYGTFKIQNK